MDKLALLNRIKAELTSYNGRMGVGIDDFKSHSVEIDADDPFEGASSIKTFILIRYGAKVSRMVLDQYLTLKGRIQ